MLRLKNGTENMMKNLLIIQSHSHISKSQANKAMINEVRNIDGVCVHHLEATYPDGKIDIAREAQLLIESQRYVLQFPINWYSTPPLLKAWQDEVLTQMFYIKHEMGALIQGRSVMVAATAGNNPEAYGPNRVNLFPLEDLLKPLHATANRCGLKWHKPFLTYSNNRASAEKIAEDSALYFKRIKEFMLDADGGN
jgi:putative NADPH-quinone reductase